MWLINVRSMRLQYFDDNDIPPYAILSHTWGKEEVSFQEFRNLRTETKAKAGYTKILNACATASSPGHNFSWLWVDTCCIDKSSSAELSEAINSMWRYYRNSAICYAYLDDVQCLQNSDFLGCKHARWWKGGWTLQELIAPKLVNFYSSDWSWFGTRNASALLISTGTGIPVEVLEGEDPRNYCITQRFSWAAARETTRLEDTAYCLLGLLDVNIPLLYGEGRKAFFRLQEELIRVADDTSIFGWRVPSTFSNPRSYVSGALAGSPAFFADCQDVQPFSPHTPSYRLKNQGLAINLILYEVPTKTGVLYATRIMEAKSDGPPSYLYLEHLYSNRYVRIGYEGPAWVSTKPKEEKIIIQQRNIALALKDPGPAAGMVFRIGKKGDWTPKHVHVFVEHPDHRAAALKQFRNDIAKAQSINHGESILAPFYGDLKVSERPWVAIGVDARDAFYEGRTAHVLLFEFGLQHNFAAVVPGRRTSMWFRWSVRTRKEALVEGFEYKAAEKPKWCSIKTLRQPVPIAPSHHTMGRIPPAIPIHLQPDSQWQHLDYNVNSSRSAIGTRPNLSVRCHAHMLNNRFYLVTDIAYTESRSHNLGISHFNHDQPIFNGPKLEDEPSKRKEIQSWSQHEFKRARKKSRKH